MREMGQIQLHEGEEMRRVEARRHGRRSALKDVSCWEWRMRRAEGKE